jgi:hypothetical protein
LLPPFSAWLARATRYNLGQPSQESTRARSTRFSLSLSLIPPAVLCYCFFCLALPRDESGWVGSFSLLPLGMAFPVDCRPRPQGGRDNSLGDRHWRITSLLIIRVRWARGRDHQRGAAGRRARGPKGKERHSPTHPLCLPSERLSLPRWSSQFLFPGAPSWSSLPASSSSCSFCLALCFASRVVEHSHTHTHSLSSYRFSPEVDLHIENSSYVSSLSLSSYS